MTKLTFMLVAVALGGCFATVDGRGRVVGGEAAFTLSLPTVLPPLVVVEPGISVVADLDEEVFFADGYYWARRDGSWIRTRDHRGSWTRVEGRYVPAPLQRAPPGRYKHYRGERGGGERGDHDRR